MGDRVQRPNSGLSRLYDGFLKSDKGIYRRFFGMIRKTKLPFVWLAVYIIIRIVLVKFYIDVTQYTAKMFSGDVNFASIIVPFVLYTLANAGLSAVSTFISWVCIARIDRNMKRMVWRKVISLPLSFFERNKPKELISRIVSDAEQISQLIIFVFLEVAIQIYSLWAVLTQISSYDGRLVWSLIALFPLFIVISVVLGKLNYGIADTVNTKNAEFTRNLSETVGHAEVVKAYGREEHEAKRSQRRIAELYRYSIRNSWIGQLSGPVFAITTAIEFIVIALVGRHFLSSGVISLQEWIAFFAFSANIVGVFSAGYWSSFKAAQGSVNRVSHIVAQTEERTDGIASDSLHGNIVFEDVSFFYGEHQVLSKFRASISASGITAIAGPSGSGKTTLLNLIDRLQTPDSGRITVGGIDVADYAVAGYREAVVYIPQNSVFFAGTLRQNFLYGVRRESVPEDELNDALRLAGAYDFVRALPGQLDYELGENGSGLSGGERQILVLARAILKKPRYLILDESFSQLDADRKTVVWESIRKIAARAAVIVVGHDRQTIAHANRLLLIEGGNLIDSGTPKELFARSERYRRLIGEEEEKS
ncbi:ABC transporter ATP-binding protein/permease [Sporolactobacillus shoreicorticis]|uniref:ABC transporter ATP-binding protein n=1 Tax=Sporolactobacillus shoreicorticis TaxID=1923877 RepID=A0ABW5S3M1_9BACL|nr:ABC transporter ATP-binding protein [Sporolactobacillus shoreicorticis]MCO7127867.1 ABC transporter ATP-binding protein/permease [Sporolactobacillus shoreicorticis]